MTRDASFTPRLVDEQDQQRLRKADARWWPTSVGFLIFLGIFVVTLVNFLVSGIPNLSTGSTVWESDQPFPLIHIPSWIVIVMCAMPLLAAILMWNSVDARHRNNVTTAAGSAFIFFMIIPIPILFIYSESGPFVWGEQPLGWYWIGSLVALVGGIALLILRARLKPAPAALAGEYEQEEAWLYERAARDERARAQLDRDLANLAERRAAHEREQAELSELFASQREAARAGDSGSREERRAIAEQRVANVTSMVQRHADAKAARDRAGRSAQELR